MLPTGLRNGWEVGMSDAAGTKMSAPEFRDFQARRPQHERWELIDGSPSLMPPAYLDHDRISGNLERLLNKALKRHAPSREAVRHVGIEPGVNDITLARLGLNQDYRPDPDLVVTDRLPHKDRRLVFSAYLIAEVVSAGDRERICPNGRQWLGIKGILYTQHPFAEAVLEIEHDRIEVRLLVRESEGWLHDTLTEPEGALVLDRFGLRCLLKDIYAGTSVYPRPWSGSPH
jgi:Uma2 family endonuclease